jgi:hypothetical protein
MIQISADFTTDFAQETAAQVRCAALVYAKQTFRLGAFREARKLCLELVEKSIADSDFQNLFASQRLLAMLNSNSSRMEYQSTHVCNSEVSNSEVSNTELSLSALRQRSLLDATRLYQLGKTSEAAKEMRSVCLDLGDWRGVDDSNSSAFVELATMAREVMLATPRGQETTYNEYKRLYRWALKNAKRVAQRFEQEKPHTYREEAWENALFGGSGHVAGLTLRSLMSSLLRARALGFVAEEIATFVSWDSMCQRYELGVLEMPQLERARYDDLIGGTRTSPQSKSSEVQANTSSTLEMALSDDDLEASFEDVLDELSSALNLSFQTEVAGREVAHQAN